MTTCTHCFHETNSGGPCPHCGHDPSRRPWRPPALPPGTEVGGEYRLGRVLGQGGFGITYVALDVKLERRVAVKEFFPSALVARGADQTVVVPTDEGRFADWRRRFLDESKALARLEHAHVVRVLRFFEAGGTAYMVMEYYEGETLAERLDRVGRMTPPEALAVMGPILEALEAAHGMRPHPLIHQDVKPANIFLLAGGRPVLLDFGAARHAAMGDDPKSLSVVPTSGYAPYEQYSRRGSRGPWTDVYSAAATLYRMVTGEDTPDAVDRKDDDQLKPPQAVAPAIGRAFSQAVQRGLAMSPQDRPQTARAFRELLQSSLVPAGGTLREEDVATELESTVVRTRLDGDSTKSETESPLPPAVIPALPALVVCPLCGKKNKPENTSEFQECKANDPCPERRGPQERICEACGVKRAGEAERKAAREKREAEEKKAAEAAGEKEKRLAAEKAKRAAEEAERQRREEEASQRKTDVLTGEAWDAPARMPASPSPRPVRGWVWSALVVAAIVVEVVLVIQDNKTRVEEMRRAIASIKFARIAAGGFTMGSESPDADSDERPLHPVTFSRPFELQTTEVTQAQ